ncbi:MAG: type II secretion system F family protein [Nanoarchaeota archaeon]|nr:type II secretion system F family protein [Nanoarchaeota archaeon]
MVNLKKHKLEIIFMISGVALLIFNFLFIGVEFAILSPLLNVVGGLIAVVPTTLLYYKTRRSRGQIESQFINFIRDLTESISTGMTLPMALNQCSKRDYLALSPYIRDIASQVDWGIPFSKALQTFAKKSGSTSIKRAISTIIETYKVGGKITNTLKSVSRSLITIEKIKQERTASVHAQILTSYMIFFIFIFILVILQTFLVPALTPPDVPGVSAMPSQSGGVDSELYSESFINFIVIQGLFAGLATGKMAEGSIIAGLKHSILLVVVGYTTFSLAVQFEFASLI